MVYTVHVFRELCERFPAWNDLQNFLVSDEGGRLRIIQDESNPEKYVIIRYEKESSNFHLPHVRWFRSVVWNTETNRPVCIAPPKASTDNDVPLSSKRIYQDYLDGTMINCFKDVEQFYTVTRSSFNATGTFYSQKSFGELLNEAYEFLKSKDPTVPTSMQEWLPQVDDAKTVCMSLLLQHPAHRVVNIVNEPNIFIVHFSRIYEDGTVIINEDVPHHSIPTLQGPKEGQPLTQWFSQLVEMHGWDWQGITVKDGQGNRWRMRANMYRMIRSLRGNTPKDDIRFAQLYESKLLLTYLVYYPEDRIKYMNYYNKIHYIKKYLYDLYVRCHITKTLKKENMNSMWKPHLFSLHGLFLYTLKEKKQFIREKDVGMYIDALKWPQLYQLMQNYDRRSLGVSV